MKLRLLIVVSLVVTILTIGLAVNMRANNQPIPHDILKQAAFGIWYPAANPPEFKVDRGAVKYSVNGQDKLVTFVARGLTNNLSFTEQAVPDSFNDIPQLYDKLIEKLRAYSTFDSVNGTVSLTRPEELKGGQTAVMRAKGTMVFVRPDKDLSADDWRRLMNNLSFAR